MLGGSDDPEDPIIIEDITRNWDVEMDPKTSSNVQKIRLDESSSRKNLEDLDIKKEKWTITKVLLYLLIVVFGLNSLLSIFLVTLQSFNITELSPPVLQTLIRATMVEIIPLLLVIIGHFFGRGSNENP